jgi:hypothetical protein
MSGATIRGSWVRIMMMLRLATTKKQCVEYEHQTFKHLWEESGKNSEEARHFMRVTQRECYEDDRTGKTQLDHMPDVIHNVRLTTWPLTYPTW